MSVEMADILRANGRCGVRMQLDEILADLEAAGINPRDVQVSGTLKLVPHEFVLSDEDEEEEHEPKPMMSVLTHTPTPEPVRPDAEAERLRAGLLDLDPYSPVE